MLPDISAERILAAMDVYDRDERPTHYWEVVGAAQGHYKYRYAVEHEGRLYPVTRLIRLATKAELRTFQSNPEATTYLFKRGFKVMTRRGAGSWRPWQPDGS